MGSPRETAPFEWLPGIRVAQRLAGRLNQVVGRIPEPQPVGWSVVTYAGLFTIVGLWVFLFAITWAKWGDVTIDTGREMYVPVELSQGKTLYRDIWYPYGPLAPYLNSVLYKIFGVNLAVLYWAGSVSALACAVLLYLIGMQLASWLAGWAAAAVLLAEAFNRSLFCFPLPYSFAAVYGLVSACICLWCCVKAARSKGFGWTFGGSSAAAAALLSKPEIGFACWVALSALIALRAVQLSSFRRLTKDILATLPGIAASVTIVGWLLSLGGADFLIQENLMGFPSTYFAKEYGPKWNHLTGMAFDGRALNGLAVSSLAVLWLVAIRLAIKRYGAGWGVFLVMLGGAQAIKMVAVRIGVPLTAARSMFFPPAMTPFVVAAIPLLIALIWRTKVAGGFLALLVLVIGSGALAIRTFFWTVDNGYSIYFNGPLVLAFLLLAAWLALPHPSKFDFFVRPAEALPFVALAIAVLSPTARMLLDRDPIEPWRTNRGLIFLPPGMPARYEAAVEFMRDAARQGDYTLSVPEDVSLYFFSGTHCPLRFYAFSPGVIAPEQMDDVIARIEATHVRYLIWSNRSFPEYGTPEFGKDFDQPLGAYFRRYFRPMITLPGRGKWAATIWERVPGQAMN